MTPEGVPTMVASLEPQIEATEEVQVCCSSRAI
jgi:hypothetical protein